MSKVYTVFYDHSMIYLWYACLLMEHSKEYTFTFVIRD